MQADATERIDPRREPGRPAGGAGPLPPGAVVSGYTIVRTVGIGGMGIVYLANDPAGATQVALKTVRVPRADLFDTIRREIHALSRLSHPGIVPVLAEKCATACRGTRCRSSWARASGRSPGSRNRDSHDGVRGVQGTRAVDTTCADHRVVLTLVRRLCHALAYMHGEGLVHRDLKPDNVIVRPDGTPLLVDFGLTSVFGGDVSRDLFELHGEVIGTPDYMAPEQVRGEAVDPRTDLYGLGCMLHELLTGQPPFCATAPALVLAMHLKEDPEPPSRIAPWIPPALDELVLRLLSKDPRSRIGHADDVAATLEELGAAPWDVAVPAAKTYLYRAALAGRSAEVRLLDGALDRLRHRRGGLALLAGESGAGKTRLAVEIASRARSRGCTVLSGECRLEGGPLEALEKPLRAIADHCLEAGAEVADRIVGLRGPILAACAPELASLPGHDRQPVPEELPAKDARLRVLVSLAETFGALAAEGPLILVLDDLQWGGDLLIAWLELLSRSGAFDAAPFLVIGAYRSEEAPAALERLSARPDVLDVKVGRLGDDALAEIVSDMMARPTVPDPFVRFLSEASGGNPFYVAEYLRAAVAGALLTRIGGAWHVAEGRDDRATIGTYRALPLPGTVRELAEKRLQGLDDVERPVVAAAAVLGRDVELYSLAALAGETAVRDALDRLVARQLLEHVGQQSVRFAHDQLREIAYAQIPEEKRRQLHQSAAAHLRALSAERLRARQGDLALHHERAGEPELAATSYREAARDAVERYAHEDASRFYRGYLRVVERAQDRMATTVELADRVLIPAGWTQEAEATLEEALELSREAQDVRCEAAALRHLGTVHQYRGQMEAARGRYEEALALSRLLEDRGQEGSILGSLGFIDMTLGLMERARDRYERALHILKQLPDPGREAFVLGSLANLEYVQGRLDAACERIAEALRYHRRAGNRRSIGHLLGNLANIHHDQGRMDEARALCEEALAINREIGNRRAEGLTLANLANMRFEQGALSEAKELYGRALAVHRQVGDAAAEAIALANLGNLARDEGATLAAEDLYGQALRSLELIGDRRVEAGVKGNLALLKLSLGLMDEAGALLREALATHREIRSRRGEASALVDLAMWTLQSGGDVRTAESLCDEAGEILETLGNPLERGWLLATRGHVRHAAGTSAAAEIAEGRTIALSLGAGPDSQLGRALKKLENAEGGFLTPGNAVGG
ncbi:MAG: tetratricopeptide repeat protein [Acidobacteriota bacterium]